LFSIFAVLSLAIGVGVTTAVYSVVHSIFLKDLGIRDPGQVVFVVMPYATCEAFALRMPFIVRSHSLTAY
jgi:hypothetical protein